MNQTQVIQRITELGRKILPEGASLWLYGSRARGDNSPDSDYDLLILLDKDEISDKDYADYVFTMRMMGWKMDEDINPQIYPRKEWNTWQCLPFHDNVEQDKIVLR